MPPNAAFTIGETMARPNLQLSGARKTYLSLLLSLLMLATPATAFISPWVGPNSVSGTSQSVGSAFQVPGNATVLDAWLNVGEDGMPTVGSGSGWHSADLPGNMSVGQFTGTTLTHFSETLSLQPNGSFSNIAHFTNSTYQLPLGWTETGGAWGMSGLTNITGNIVNGKRVVAHGEIPPSPHGGGILAATSAGTALSPGTNAILTSPSLPIPYPLYNFSIGFWHWYHLDTPTNSNGDADGAWVEISLDNGSWTWIEPAGGYGNTASPTFATPNGAATNGTNGFPAFASVNSSGWQFANFSLDNVSGINNASNLQLRFRTMTMSNATARPGWFIDDIEVYNEGNSTGVWHHGCYSTTTTCSYSADAEGVLEFPTIDLSSAVNGTTVSFMADWDLEGDSYDNWWLEASRDNQTWIDITTPNTNYSIGGWVQPDGIPTQGVVIGGTTYTDDSGGWVRMNFPLPANFIGDNTTWIRFRVVADYIIDYGDIQDNLEGLIIDDVKVHENNSTIFMYDNFSSATTATHYALNQTTNNSADDWTYRILGMGFFSDTYGFEDSPALPPGGWQVQNTVFNTGWEFGTAIGSGPTSWPSAPAGFGTVLGGSYDSNSWEHLFSPQYTIPAGASARFTFTHWICAESSWDGGAVYISVNNGTWTYFDNIYANGTSWYDGTITSHTTSPLYNMKVFDGSSRVSAGQFSCNGAGNQIPWVTELADLGNYSGSDVQFRFSFTSDGSVQYEGWLIDDVGLEVDYFDPVGSWTSPIIPADEHGYGFVDVEALIPEETWVTATIRDSGNIPIAGYVNQTLPLDLAGLNPLALPGGIHVELTLGTDDPYLSPLVSAVNVGSVRYLEPISANSTGWILPATGGLEVNETGYLVNTGGVTQTLESPFTHSGVPIDGLSIDGDFQGVTISLDTQYATVGGITNTGSYFLPDISPGFGISIAVQPGGWIEWMSFEGNMVAPALNAEVDVASDGVTDWSFPADPNYGAFGWQDRIAGNGLSNSVDTRSQSFTMGSSSGLSLAGTQNYTVSSPVQWSGIHQYDVLHVLCGIASCGQITGSFTVYANTIIVELGASMSADGMVWGGQGQGTSTTAAANGAGDGGGGAGHAGAGGAGGGGNSNGGSSYGASTNESGSSGGNSTYSGGATSLGGKGGGAIALFAITIIVNGTISADGAEGDLGQSPASGTGPGGHGAGGGSGGIVHGIADTITIGQWAEISAKGGDGGDGSNGVQAGIGIGMYNGGNGGGGGGGGIVKFLTTPNGLTNNGAITVSPGFGGSGGSAYGSGNNGANGQSGTTGTTSNPTNFSGWTSSATTTTTVLLPSDANVVAGRFSLYSPAGENLTVEVAGTQVTSISGPWQGVVDLTIPSSLFTTINSLTATHTDSTGRQWSEVQFSFSGDDQSFDLSGIKFGYELNENVTNLGQQVKDYHEMNNQNGLANSVDIPLDWSSDRGGVSLAGGVLHELMITNEPFTVPTTFHPTGVSQGFLTGHHHLVDNGEIGSIVLNGQGSSDDITVIVSNLANGGTFTQTSGQTMLSIDENLSSAQLLAGSWIIDWQFSVPWSWDDESQINWTAQAFNHSGEGLAPASAMSGGSGSQASENDLEIDSYVVSDTFGRLLSNEWDPSYPFYAEASTLVNISGTVRFQNTADIRPMADDFVVSINVSGIETFVNSTATGMWVGSVLLPTSASGQALVEVANISASIIRVGPIVGAIGAEDATTPGMPIVVQLDANSPSVVTLELDTPQGLMPADGFTWDPDSPLAVVVTVYDDEALGDDVTLNIWREFIDDANTNGIPDESEYWNTSVALPSGTVGEKQVSFQLIDVTETISNGNVSLFISGSDWAGIAYSNAGLPGYASDFATLVTATNTPTTFSVASLSLDRYDEYILAGQTHTLSFALADENGIHTLDRIDIHMQGQDSLVPATITIDPRSGSITTDSDFLLIKSLTITDLGDGQGRFDVEFSITWEAPESWESEWAIPEIMVYDDDLVNPSLSIPNLAQIRWVIDRDLALVIESVQDLTPPLSVAESNSLYLAPGDALRINGNLTYAQTGQTVVEVPMGLSTRVYLEYDFQEVSNTIEIGEDGSFSAGIVLPGREITDPVLTIRLELYGMPGLAVDSTSDTYTIIVDSASPTVSFSAIGATIDSLLLADFLMLVTISDDAGIPDQNLTINWQYRRNGLAVSSSGGQQQITLDSRQGLTVTFSGNVDLDTNADIQLGDVIIIWVVAYDNAGKEVTGIGSQSDPLAVEVLVREFNLNVASITIGHADGRPFTGNQAVTGNEIAFTVTLRNSGNLAGVVNVTLSESRDDGTWIEHQSIEISLPEAGTRTLDPLLFEAYLVGEQSLFINITGDIDKFSAQASTPGCAMIGPMVQCSLSEEVDMPTVVSAESLEQDGGTMFILIITIALSLILVLAVLFYRRSTEVDPYADEGVWEDQTRHVVENMYEAKQAPAIPASVIQPEAVPSPAPLESTTSSWEVDGAIEVALTEKSESFDNRPQSADAESETTVVTDAVVTDVVVTEAAGETLETPGEEVVAETDDEDAGGLDDIQDSKPAEEPLDWDAEW